MARASKRLKNFRRIVRRYISFAMWMILLISMGFVYWRYTIVNDKFNEEHLLTTANIAMDMIDGDVHSKIGVTEGMNSSSYNLIQRELESIRDSSEDFLYVYTWRMNEDGKLVFIVDADAEEDSALGVVYDEKIDILDENYFDLKEPILDPSYTVDDWGILRSVYAPIYTSTGHLDGVIGIDMARESFAKGEQDFLIVIAIIFVGTSAFAVFLSSWVTNTLMKPFEKFTKEVVSSARSNFKKPVSESNIEMLSQLSRSFNKAILKAKRTNEDIQKEVEERTTRLESLNEKMVDREVRMRELKSEISELKKKNNV